MTIRDVVAYLGWALLVVLLLAWWFRYLRVEAKLKQGVTTTGTITAHQTSRGRKTFYYIFYQFPLSDNRTWNGRQEVHADHFERLREGQPVQVRYVPDEPWISKLVGQDADDVGNGGLIVGITITILLFILLAFLIIRRP